MIGCQYTYDMYCMLDSDMDELLKLLDAEMCTCMLHTVDALHLRELL